MAYVSRSANALLPKFGQIFHYLWDNLKTSLLTWKQKMRSKSGRKFVVHPKLMNFPAEVRQKYYQSTFIMLKINFLPRLVLLLTSNRAVKEIRKRKYQNIFKSEHQSFRASLNPFFANSREQYESRKVNEKFFCKLRFKSLSISQRSSQKEKKKSLGLKI